MAVQLHRFWPKQTRPGAPFQALGRLTYPGIKALRKGVDEFHTCVTCNAYTIANYAERHRYGERVSTAFVESTVNTVVGKRFSKRQQMSLVKARRAPDASDPNPGAR